MSRTLMPLALAALAATAAAATDPREGFLDLRLGYTFLDKEYEATVEGGVDSGEFDNDWDNQHRGFAMLAFAFGAGRAGGIMFGVDVTVDYRDDDPRGTAIDLEYESYGAHAHVGWYLPIGKVFQLEVLPFVGFAAAQFEQTLPGNLSTDDNETLIEFGANVNGIFALGRLLLGVQVGYLRSDTEGNLETAGEESEYDFGPGNLLASAMLGVRF